MTTEAASRLLTNKRRVFNKVVIVLALVAPGVWVLAAFARTMIEQTTWMANANPARIDVRSIQYAEEGLVLEVYAPAGVAEAWRRDKRVNPFRSQHHRCPFWVADEKTDGSVMVLVDYPFRPKWEWLLALKSSDGSWWHGSPYFPEAPTVSDEEWTAYQERSRKVLPR